jgi:hypothetical protein
VVEQQQGTLSELVKSKDTLSIIDDVACVPYEADKVNVVRSGIVPQVPPEIGEV